VALVPALAEPDADAIDRTFRALADPSRRLIVARLSRGAATVSELAEPLEMSLPAVMQHLDLLQDVDLVRTRKVGRVRTCTLEPAPLRAVERWIADHRATWESKLDRLGDVINATYGGAE
jgi:DNA-binding transcriptional ArsR family regulator